MFELAGDLRLVDEAHHVAFVRGVEHDLHGDGALSGRLMCVEDRAHAAARDDLADGVAFISEEFVGKKAPNDVAARPAAFGVLGRWVLTPDFEGDIAEPDVVMRFQPGGFRDRLLADECAV